MKLKDKSIAEVQDRIQDMTKDKTINGQIFMPLYLGDKTPRKKIQCKEDLEEEIGVIEDESCRDTEFLTLDMISQR